MMPTRQLVQMRIMSVGTKMPFAPACAKRTDEMVRGYTPGNPWAAPILTAPDMRKSMTPMKHSDIQNRIMMNVRTTRFTSMAALGRAEGEGGVRTRYTSLLPHAMQGLLEYVLVERDAVHQALLHHLLRRGVYSGRAERDGLHEDAENLRPNESRQFVRAERPFSSCGIGPATIPYRTLAWNDRKMVSPPMKVM